MQLRKFRNSRREESLDLNVTSFIDIMLVLLIFFMVTSNINNITNLNLQLPKVDKNFSLKEFQELNLTITSDGSYYLNNEKLVNNQKRTLLNAINNLSNDKRELPFVLAGDGKAPYQAIITALDVAGELGFTNIKFAAVKTN